MSVGNVPQLAVDLIINTFELEKLGWVNDDSILPLVGNGAFSFNSVESLNTSAERM